MRHQFICVIYLPDSKDILQTKVCDTATEAIEQATKWRAVGHIAQAYLEAFDLDTLEMYHFPLN